jgi:hypothetical protein
MGLGTIVRRMSSTDVEPVDHALRLSELIDASNSLFENVAFRLSDGQHA